MARMESRQAPYPTQSDLRELARPRTGLCVSIYLPLETAFPRPKLNTLRYRQSVDQAQQRLKAAGADPEAVASYVERLMAVPADAPDLTRPARTLAVFLDAERLLTLRLTRAEPTQVAVGRSFIIRPVVREVRHDRRYLVLALSVNHVALFEGDEHGLHATDSTGIPGSLEDALGSELARAPLQYHSAGAPGHAAVFHGQGGASDERATDLERFHRVVARAVAARLKGRVEPVVLAADRAHHGEFQARARLPRLLPDGVIGSPEKMSADELHARAWPIVEAAIAREEEEAAHAFERARKQQKGLDRLDAIVSAAVVGRVRRLWEEHDRRMAGRIAEPEGRVVDTSDDEDVLDELAAIVLRHGGDVLVVESGKVPARSGLAAELR